MRVSAFWDSSALVPLCVREENTPAAMAAYRTYDVAVWWATPIEIASAIDRLLRMKQIDSADCAKARKLARRLTESWVVVQPSRVVREKSIQLLERYDLRAADALQLAAALEWCEDSPNGHIFFSTDQRLRDAALLSGFDTKPTGSSI
jgi:predicted nucleic acid-binding protein